MPVRLWRDAGAHAQVNGHEKMLVAALRASVASVKGSARASGVAPVASQLRPVPYLMYIADGNSDSHFNVFEKLPAAELKVLQRIFRRHPEVDCSAGGVLGDGTGGAGEYKARREQPPRDSPEAWFHARAASINMTCLRRSGGSRRSAPPLPTLRRDADGRALGGERRQGGRLLCAAVSVPPPRRCECCRKVCRGSGAKQAQ